MTRYLQAFCSRSALQLKATLLANCQEQEGFDEERERITTEKATIKAQLETVRGEIEALKADQQELRESMQELNEDQQELKDDQCYQKVLKEAGEALAACKYSLLMGGISFDQIYDDCNAEYDMFVASRSETRGCR